MKKLESTALLDFQYLSDLTVSPKEKSAAFVVKKAKADQTGYDSYIYAIDLDSEKVWKLTSSGSDSGMIYDDENTLLFPSVRKESDAADDLNAKTVFYKIALNGGEAEEAFAVPYTVDKIGKVCDGVYVFSAEVDLNQPKTQEESQYHVLEELPFWKNGGYFASRFRNSLFILEEKTGEVTQLTPPLFAADNFKIAQSKVYYTGVSYDAVLPDTNGLYVYDVQSKATQTLIDSDKIHIDSFDIEPTEEGNHTVWLAASTMDKYGNGQYPDLYRCENKEMHLAAVYGNGVGTSAAGDTVLGGGFKFQVYQGALYFVSMTEVNAELYQLQKDANQAAKVIPFDGSIDCFAMTGDKVLMIARKPGKLSELYVYDQKTCEEKQLQSFNEEVLKDTYVAQVIDAGFIDSDGVKIEGYVILPKDYDPKKKYPGILDMHGGPKGAFGTVYFHEMQWLANEGYFVFFCNPRGSDGKGNEFADLRGKYGNIDYKDFMEFTDHVLEMFPSLDKNRLGVTGGSYGGWMTNWIIGHTDRFAAAVSCRSFCNFLSDFGASEIGYSFDVNENAGKTPWTAPEQLWKHSPIAYADRAKTPTLFIHSIKDYNCPISEGLQMFAALKYHGVPSKAFLIEGENHELSRSGKPIHRLRRLTEMKSWFDRYLKLDQIE